MANVKLVAKGLDKVERALQLIHERGANTLPLMGIMGAMMVATVDRNFEAEGRPTRWVKRKQLSNDNLQFGAMKTASKTKRYQNAKRVGTKASILRGAALKTLGNRILQDSGKLKQSMTFKASTNSVEVGPSGGLPYARIHQLGGIIRPVKARYLAIPNGNGILRAKEVHIPARPYLTVPPEDVPKYAAAVMEWLKGDSLF